MGLGGEVGGCEAEVVIEGGLRAEAEEDDEDGAVHADVGDGDEGFDAGAVGGSEVGKPPAAAIGCADGAASEAVDVAADGGVGVEVGEGAIDVVRVVGVVEGGLEVDVLLDGEAEAEAGEELTLDGCDGNGVEGVGAVGVEGGGEGEGGVVVDEDGGGEGRGWRGRAEGGDDVEEGEGEGEVEGVAGDATALVKAVGLVVGDEVGT